MAKFSLLEGMRCGDLTSLVLPLVSIDEFESKIDEDAIVIGFYVNDKDAAKDLNRFIQRSPIELLDSEVSPASDQNGNFMVFVELLRNNKTANEIYGIIDEISPLCGIENWKIQIRGMDDLFDLSESNLQKALDKNKRYDERHPSDTNSKKIKESVIKILEQSDLDNVIILQNNDGYIVNVIKENIALKFELVKFGNYKETISACNLQESSFNLDSYSVSKDKEISNMLGGGWTVLSIEDKTVWTRDKDEMSIILKPLK